jgi:hypothetical protein
METKIKDKWCTYGAWGKKSPTFIGKLLEQLDKSGTILYSESQMYPPELWDMGYVELFDTVEEAIIYMMKNDFYNRSLNRIRENLSFPSDTNNIDWNNLSKIEEEINEKKIHGIKY